MTGHAQIEIGTYHCRNCSLDFSSGAAAPQCLRCRSTNLERRGVASRVTVPDPVPANTVPDAETVQAVAAQRSGPVQLLTYRCGTCGWATQWPAGGEAPASISAHEKTHAGEFG